MKHSHSPYTKQILAAFILNILTFCHGLAFGWVSPLMKLLYSPETPLYRPVTIEELSWIGANTCLGGLFGDVFAGVFLNRIGRKKTMIISCLPQIGLWIITIFATDVYHFYIARFLGGFAGGALYVANPIYIAEISSKEIRGRLGSVLVFLQNIGILIGYIGSSYLHYKTFGLLALALPITCLILTYFILPDTPQFLLRNNREEEAEKSLSFYRNKQEKMSQEASENLRNEFIELKKIISESSGDNSRISLRDLTDKKVVKAFSIGMGLMIMSQATGGYTFINYASTIFDASYSEFDANYSTIIMGVVQIVGTTLSIFLVDKIGRRMLLIISAFGMSACLFLAGLYQRLYISHDLSGFTWIPTVTISAVILFGSTGVFSTTFVLFVELMPSKVRPIGTMICLMTFTIIGLLALRYFPVALELIHLEWVLFICSVGACGMVIFVLLFIKETKGTAIDDNSK